MGDRSHTYYVTLYSSKDTNPEDKRHHQRVATAVARRVFYQQLAHRQAGNAGELAREPDFGEGLGVLLTGINAFSSHDVVASTMSHNLVYNRGKRFHFSHEFKPLLLSMAEAVLEGGPVDLVLRRTRRKDGENESWADCLFHDYLYRPDDLRKWCFYEFVMWWDRHRLSGKDVQSGDRDGDGDQNERKAFRPGHPGKKYLYLEKRGRYAIPRISAGRGKLCNLRELKWTDPFGVYDPIVTKKREDYAKYALILFKPFTELDELKCDGSFWKKFCDELDAHKEKQVSEGQFWGRGFQILQNMQDRETASTSSGRARDPVVKGTTCNVPNGERKKQGIDGDDEDAFDVDINEFDSHAVEGANDTTFQASLFCRTLFNVSLSSTSIAFQSLQPGERRSHDGLIRKGNINTDKYAAPTVEATSSLLPQTGEDSGSGVVAASNEAPAGGAAPQATRVNYATILTFIRGTLLGADGPDDDNAEDGASVNEGRNADQGPLTLRGFVATSGKNFDRKQYAAYKILCCSFLLGLVKEGTIGCSPHEGLEDFFRGLGNDPALAASKAETEALLVRHGAMDQLVMLVTGQGGSGKSTCVSLAQRFCHSFCARLAILFDDKTFTFTSTTGSSAAIFGGTTVHSAAYLNRVKITDCMRQEWRNIKVLVLDEVSFFRTSDIERLDKVLKRLTGRNKKFGGVHIVFSGDFYQLQPGEQLSLDVFFPPCNSRANASRSFLGSHGEARGAALQSFRLCHDEFPVGHQLRHHFGEEPSVQGRSDMGRDPGTAQNG